MTANLLARAKFNAASFGSNRGYFYVLALIAGACITDSPSGKEQVMIALPLMLVFEWTVILLDRFRK